MVWRRVLLVAAIAAVVGMAASGCRKKKQDPRSPVRDALWAELQPVALSNCELKRFGSVNDGGYMLCGNLLKDAKAAYSYGIEHEDNWGCQLSKELGIVIHQYDCFTADRPTCEGGQFDFHSECIGPKADTVEGKPFDTLAAQIEKNGDKGKNLVIKMDVEGAEWDSIMATPDELLATVDQFVFELHGVDEQKFVDVVKKLKNTFHVVWFHSNNWACNRKRKLNPFPSDAYEVLFVNKRLGTVDPKGKPHVAGAAPDMPNNPNAPDCQTMADLKKKPAKK